jgi:hypothetical protein
VRFRHGTSDDALRQIVVALADLARHRGIKLAPRAIEAGAA